MADKVKSYPIGDRSGMKVRGTDGEYGDGISVDNQHVSPWLAFGAGATAGGVMTFLTFLARTAGWTSLNLEMIMGTLFSGTPSSGSWWLGFALHLVVSGLIGMAYGAAFKVYNRSGAGAGASFSIVHWIVGGVFFAVLPAVHPLYAETLPSPGLFMLNWGLATALVFFLAHLAYGSLTGALYRSAARSEAGQHRPLPASV